MLVGRLMLTSFSKPSEFFRYMPAGVGGKAACDDPYVYFSVRVCRDVAKCLKVKDVFLKLTSTFCCLSLCSLKNLGDGRISIIL